MYIMWVQYKADVRSNAIRVSKYNIIYCSRATEQARSKLG